jgi:hypothetical protein
MKVEDVDEAIEIYENKKQFTIESVFIELAQKKHSDVYELSSEILSELYSKKLNMFDYAKVVNEVNILIYNVENNKLQSLKEIEWLKEFKIERDNNKIKLVHV